MDVANTLVSHVASHHLRASELSVLKTNRQVGKLTGAGLVSVDLPAVMCCLHTPCLFALHQGLKYLACLGCINPYMIYSDQMTLHIAT